MWPLDASFRYLLKNSNKPSKENVNANAEAAPAVNAFFEKVLKIIIEDPRVRFARHIATALGDILAPKDESSFTSTLSAHFRENEHTLRYGGALKNFLGRSECVDIDGMLGSRGSYSAKVRLWRQEQPQIALSIFHKSNFLDAESSFRALNTGALLTYAFKTLHGCKLTHSFEYEAAWRQLGQTAASRSHRRFDSLLRYVLRHDSRNKTVYPATSLLFESINVCGGLPYSDFEPYLSTFTRAKLGVPLGAGFTAQLNANAGLSRGIQFTTKSRPLHNRRSYKVPGFLCTSNNNIAQSDLQAFWSAGACLWMPAFLNKGLRLRLFYDIGKSNSISTTQLCSAYGVGLSLLHDKGIKFEMNYAAPQPTAHGSVQFKFDIELL